jgi:hypothetical protein
MGDHQVKSVYCYQVFTRRYALSCVHVRFVASRSYFFRVFLHYENIKNRKYQIFLEPSGLVKRGLLIHEIESRRVYAADYDMVYQP